MSDEKKPKQKWQPEIISPGEAWMDHVEKHHNAGAATPSFLKEKSQAVQEIEKVADQIKKDLHNPDVKMEEQTKAKVKDREKEPKMSK